MRVNLSDINPFLHCELNICSKFYAKWINTFLRNLYHRATKEPMNQETCVKTMASWRRCQCITFHTAKTISPFGQSGVDFLVLFCGQYGLDPWWQYHTSVYCWSADVNGGACNKPVDAAWKVSFVYCRTFEVIICSLSSWCYYIWKLWIFLKWTLKLQFSSDLKQGLNLIKCNYL